MSFSRSLAALALCIQLGLAVPTEAEAGGVRVRVAPVKVDFSVGAVTVSGTLGTKRVVRKAPVARVYVPGHYAWNNRLHRVVWVAASYKAPPRPGARWVPGHYAKRGHSKTWVKGHWA